MFGMTIIMLSPGAGGMFTANTMSSSVEALGMALPGMKRQILSYCRPDSIPDTNSSLGNLWSL